MTVAGALHEIRLNPVNAKKEATAGVIWGDECGEGPCSACAMIINGRGGLACEIFLEDLAQPVTLRPLSKFPVLRDLLVDKGRIEAEKIKLNISSRLLLCTDCGLCLEACPRFGGGEDYVGPAAIVGAQLANLLDPAKDRENRLEILMGKGGIEDCGHFQNCQKSCPEEIPILSILGEISRKTARVALKKFLG